MRTFLYRLFAVLLGFGVAFGLAEIAVRVISPQETGPPRFAFHPELGDIPVPLQKARRLSPGVYDFTYSNNSQGFRGSREFGPKQPGDLRLLMLGDSFTYGLGVNDDQTFAALLERSLRQQNLPAEVINAGCPGKGTDYELKFFQTIGAGLQPDVTVWCFFCNDFADNVRGQYYTVTPEGGLRAKALAGERGTVKTLLFHFPGYAWLTSWSQAANLVKESMVNYLVKKQPQDGGAGAAGLVISYGYTAEGFASGGNRKIAAIYAEHLGQAVRQAGSELVVFYIPLAAEVEAYHQKSEISRDEKAFQDIIERRGGTLFSLTPVLAADPAPVGELYYVEGHWTRRAHAIAGEYMAGQLQNMLQELKARRGGNR